MPSDRTRNEQGSLLEQIVAQLHDYEDVKVETNVKLIPKSGDKSRRREIDVLLTTDVAGYPVRLAIQCKNHAKPISIDMVDAFLGALDDVGIPHQQGILVTVNGFQDGAVKRAKEKGIRTLELTGLTDDRLAAEITDAFQYFIYLLPRILSVTIRNSLSDGASSIVFADEKGKYCGYLYELVVNEWRRGKIPSTLGVHQFTLPIPKNWFQYFRGTPAKIENCWSTIKVEGHILRMKGTTKNFSLVDAETKEVEKLRIITEFNAQVEEGRIKEEIKSGLEMDTVSSETELTNLISNIGKISAMNRFRLPRVYTSACFHPISSRVMNQLRRENKNLASKDLNEASQLDFNLVEGRVDGSIHEKPWFGFPVIIEDLQGGFIDLRLLLRRRNFVKVLKFRNYGHLHPTPEFVDAIQTANRELGKQMIGLAN